MDFETPNHESKSLQCPWETSDSYFQLMCSCDSLILLRVYKRCAFGTTSCKSFVLWSPSIRSYKRIKCPYELPYYANSGVCYDSTADDYRVLFVSQGNETSVVTYSLRNNSWNMVIDSRYYLYVSEHQAVVNGAVHWVMCSRELDTRVIVYFDLVEEKFKGVPPPSLWKKDDDMNLVVLGGFLCAYCDIGAKQQIEVYAMKEYGKKESWTRLFIIPRVIDDTHLKPLCLTNKGQVLLSLWKMGIGIFDPEDGAFLPFGSDYGLTAIPYVESLVSLDGGV
ncbi:hypothetical protein RHSIM_RhsimUnG0121900 [Rhododendron simsii]|uniref:F-box associated beta-propeller type 1 domain-containing protein n=1 Tax=Rhododendron simsii TaxID=118357 RepID=A0A834L4T7_RHOSS|nr:hypothetical protein RHSIM_RhsimUnG0121900 [Rhododendron simsii]